VLKARELAEDYVKRLGVTSRKLAENGGRKRVTEEEVKLAAELKS
jgi:histone H3/H4